MSKYEIIIFWSEEDSAYVADVPELPGCMAHGSSYEEALINAQQAIDLWVATAQDLGREIPKPISPVIPVIVIKKPEQAVPMARALVEGGLKVLEVTLRSEYALDAIRDIARELPEAVVGAGTVTTAEQVDAIVDAGAEFMVSPGSTPRLIEAALDGDFHLRLHLYPTRTAGVLRAHDLDFEAVFTRPDEGSYQGHCLRKLDRINRHHRVVAAGDVEVEIVQIL